MATTIDNLRVSLTKHGAHKIAYLIREFDKDEIIDNINGQFKDIRIEYGQTKKNLSIDDNNVAPDIWNEIKNYGDEDIYDLVFISITFSHTNLIRTLIDGFNNGCVIKKGNIIGGKAFTNYAHTIEELGFAIEHTPDYVSFDISRIFYKFYLPKLVAELLRIKLLSIGWEENNTLIEECLRLGWNKAFGLSKEEFEKWLAASVQLNYRAISKVKAKRNLSGGIKFKKGHNSKLEGQVQVTVSDKQVADLLHNKIQNAVFPILELEYPNDEIGTEIKTNVGSVDIVRRNNSQYYFYEIKTSDLIRFNIREALSQLLEYAYWNTIDGTIRELVIIGPGKPDHEAKQYLELLRRNFSIPVYFRYFDVEDNQLHPSV